MNRIMNCLLVVCVLAIAGSVLAQTPLSITTTSPLPTATFGVSYSVQFAATGGVGTLTWSSVGAANNLPPGLTLSSAGVLSGTPSKTGSYSFPVTVQDQRQNTASGTFSVNVQSPPPVITNSSPLPDGTPTVSYSYILNATGGTAPYSWRLLSGNLPPGLSMSTAGQVTGTPTTVGTYQFTVAVTDSAQSTGTKAFSLTIQPQILTITTTSPVPNGATGVPYSLALTAAGGSPPYSWSLLSGALPDGLSLSFGGSITGTPTAVGQFTFTVRAIDSPPGTLAAQTATKSISLRITGPLTVTTPSPISASVGSSITVVMTASGGTPPYLWYVAQGSQLPAGFTLDTTSGFLTGTPPAAGTFNFTVQATDSAQGTATKALSLVATAGLTITTSSPGPAGAAGTSYSLALAAAGGVPPYTWALDSGALPGGVTLNTTTGALSGTPTATGAFSFVIRVTDSAKATVTKSFSVTINAASQSVLLSTNNLDFSAPAGGDAPAPQSFTLSTASPPGLQYTIQVDGGPTGAPAPGWISVKLLKGSTPATIPVSANQAGLQPGTYSARIVVNSSDGRQNFVAVTLTVVANTPQQLDVSPPYLRFAGPLSSLTPAEQQILLRNTGGGGALAFRVSVTGDAPWLTVTPTSGQTAPNAPGALRVVVNAQGLSTGARRAAIHIDSAAGSADIPVSLLVRQTGPVIGLDASGVRFEARETNGNSETETVEVLDLGNGAVNWQAELVSPADWLTLSATRGQATPTVASPLSFTVNSTGLAAGAYYGLVRISDPGSVNSPQYLTVVLSVAPADNLPVPRPDPEGLFFVARAGSAAPPAQSVGVFTSSTSPVPYQVSANTADGGSWLSVTPASGTSSTQNTARVNVTASPLSLTAGVYTGQITFVLAGTVRSTNVTLIVQPFTVGVAALKTRDAAGCTPAKLAMAQIGLVSSFAAPVGWPSQLALRLSDDCGDPVTNGQVVATFSNGDPALSLKLTDPGAGIYSATWAPGKTSTLMTVTARASAPNLASSTFDVSGQVTPNKVPILATNGTLNNLNPIVGAPVAPGTVAQVFGSSLATVQAEPGVVPLPSTFNGTTMLVGAFPAPLYFLSDGQLNVQIPTELQSDRDYPVIVQANGGITLPDTLTIAAAGPGILAGAGNRLIAQHGDFSLVTAAAPARQGEAIILYLVGMGATNPVVASGRAAPGTPPLAAATTQPTVTVGGKDAQLFYAGLTPGAVGLYQINLAVPTGLSAGDVPVVVTQGGVVANASVLTVQ